MNGRAGKCLRNIEKHYYVWVTGIIQYLNGLSYETEIWVNVMLLDRSALRRGAAGSFKNVQMLLSLLINSNINAALQ
jgi:hypothetical protein